MGDGGGLWAWQFRMLVDTPVALGLSGLENGYPKGSLQWVINNIYFQYFSVLITIVSAIVMIAVSHMTAEPNNEQIRSLTLETVTAEDRARTPRQLDLARSGGIGAGAGFDSRSVTLLPRLMSS
jgi:hypothetical protein